MEKKLEHKIYGKIMKILFLKIGIHSCPNEYTKSCEYKRSKSFFKLQPKSIIF